MVVGGRVVMVFVVVVNLDHGISPTKTVPALVAAPPPGSKMTR